MGVQGVIVMHIKRIITIFFQHGYNKNLLSSGIVKALKACNGLNIFKYEINSNDISYRWKNFSVFILSKYLKMKQKFIELFYYYQW